MTRPAGYVYCTPCDAVITTASTLAERARLLNAHYDREHLGRRDVVTQMPAVDWETQAMRGVLTLAQSGQPFVISDVISLGVPDAPNPRTDWARIQGKAEDLGWIETTGRLGHSKRPTAKSSPCAEWLGTAKAREAAA